MDTQESKELFNLIADIKQDMVQIKFDLKEHIRRTEALESYVSKLNIQVQEEEKSRIAEQAIHQYRRSRFDFWVKVLAAVASIGTIVFGLLKIKGFM